MGEQTTGPILECQDVRKAFNIYRREDGVRGILKNFFRREYTEVVAVKGVNLSVQAGEMLGLIGANGAGKTTLVKCLTGIVPVSDGSATLFGTDSFHLTDALKRRIALVMGQRSQLWWDLPPLDSFHLLREIYQVERGHFERRLEEYAERLGVTEQLTVQLRQLSLGQRMKMEIIGAFLHDPEVVFLDEPTIGLDLLSKEIIREFLTELNRTRGATIVLTSHDMEDIEETCKRIVILEHGGVLFDGDLVELQRRVVSERSIELHLEHNSRPWSPELDAELGVFEAKLVKQGPLSLTFSVPTAATQPLIKRLLDLLQVRDLTIERQPLEGLIREIFMTGSKR